MEPRAESTPAAATLARRAFDRTPVRAHALVHHDHRFQPVRILDFSSGGLQLDGTFGLIEQDAVQVQLLSGTQIAAKVAWSRGRRTGVTFAEPLPEGHPGMLELARRTVGSALHR